MEFAAFAERAAEIEAEPADLEVVALVAAVFAEAGEDLPVLARFLQGRVFPAHSSETLDVGPQLCYAAIARAAGPNVGADDVERRLAEVGEIGDVAASFEFGDQRGLAAFGEGRETLSVGDVDRELRRLAAAEGAGSQDVKLDVLFGLFNRCSPVEARYLARLVLSEMRIGVGEGTVRDAIAEAFGVPVDAVERALQVSNDYGLVAQVARDEDEAGLDEISLAVGRPVQAMLAQTGAVTEALTAWGEVAVQRKYDGARVQVHYDGETASLFSRNMEDVTAPLPEIASFVEAHLDGPAILDGEVVAVDEAGDPLPFQEVLRRFRRKHDVAAAREDVELQLYAFDCLHAGGEDLLRAPLLDRYARLESVLADGLAELRVTDDPAEIAAIEERSLDDGHEGILLKAPDAPYTPGRRGRNWLKCKPDVETLDVVVTGAEWGEGRRANVLGTYLLGVRDEAGGGPGGDAGTDDYETVGKVATGFTDEELEALTERLRPHLYNQTGQEVDIEPTLVFEVGYEEIQRSPTYSSGYALRFPRYEGVREDLDPSDADTLARVERLADRQ